MGNGASRAAFRYVLLELQERDVAIEEADFWDQLWKAETSPYDVFEVISPSSVRKLRTERLGNVRGLICASLAELEKTAADPDVHMVPRAMTAIRILTRVLPFLLEDYVNPETGVISPDLHRLFWSTEEAPPKAEHAAETTGDAGEKGTDGKGKEGDEVLPLGAALVSVTMRLLFTRQLTVDMFSTFDANAAAEQRTKDADGEAQNVCPRVQDPSSIWCKGLSVSEPANIQYGRDLESHRVELMRLLLVLLCEPLFQSSTNFNPASSRFAEELCRVDTPFAAELFYSLLSVIVMYDPVGWGVPYAGAFTSDMPLRQLDKAAQLLVVLLDHGKPPLPVVTNPAPQDGAFEVDVRSWGWLIFMSPGNRRS